MSDFSSIFLVRSFSCFCLVKVHIKGKDSASIIILTEPVLLRTFFNV